MNPGNTYESTSMLHKREETKSFAVGSFFSPILSLIIGCNAKEYSRCYSCVPILWIKMMNSIESNSCKFPTFLLQKLHQGAPDWSASCTWRVADRSSLTLAINYRSKKISIRQLAILTLLLFIIAISLFLLSKIRSNFDFVSQSQVRNQ